MGKTSFALDACNPADAIRLTQSRHLTDVELRRLRNRLQITINDQVKVFDVIEGEIALAGEMVATRSLLDPQKYVDTEH